MPVQIGVGYAIVAVSRIPGEVPRKELETILQNQTICWVRPFEQIQNWLENFYPDFSPWGQELNPRILVCPKPPVPSPGRTYKDILLLAVLRDDTKRINLDCKKNIATVEIEYTDNRNSWRGQINSVLGRAVILAAGMSSNSDCVRIRALRDAKLETEFVIEGTRLKILFENKQNVDCLTLQKA